MERLKGWGEQLDVQPEQVLIDLLLLAGLSLSHSIQSRFVHCLSGLVGQGGWVRFWANTAFLLLFSFLFFHLLALFGDCLLVLALELVEHVDQELYI